MRIKGRRAVCPSHIQDGAQARGQEDDSSSCHGHVCFRLATVRQRNNEQSANINRLLQGSDCNTLANIHRAMVPKIHHTLLLRKGGRLTRHAGLELCQGQKNSI